MDTARSLSNLFAVLALAVSWFALWRTGHTDKQDLFRRMHEALIEPEAVTGRRLLYGLRNGADVDALTEH